MGLFAMQSLPLSSNLLKVLELLYERVGAAVMLYTCNWEIYWNFDWDAEYLK
jgi:hypothetical protein